jgi:hypothetical protein
VQKRLAPAGGRPLSCLQQCCVPRECIGANPPVSLRNKKQQYTAKQDSSEDDSNIRRCEIARFLIGVHTREYAPFQNRFPAGSAIIELAHEKIVPVTVIYHQIAETCVRTREFALRLWSKVPWVRQRQEVEQALANSRLQVAMLQQDLVTTQQQLVTTEGQLVTTQQQLTCARRSLQLLEEPLHALWTLRSREYRNRIEKLAPELLPSWKSFGELGQDLNDYYRPTYTEPAGPFIDRIKSAPGGMSGASFLIDLGIEGFLFRTEALKLYEMAYNVESDVLELGTHKGLSTSILAHALHDRKSGTLATIELEAAFSQIATDNLQGLPGAERVTFITGDAAEAMDVLIAEKRRFDFIFVDHWHGYDATREAASRIRLLLANGGYVMFHDFFDPSNQDPDHPYGVFQAVLDTIGQDTQFVYGGATGSSALFHKMLA